MAVDIKNLCANLRGKFLQKESLAKYTAWRVGGSAEYFYEPYDLDDLVKFFNSLPIDNKVIWLGGGSNVLIRDNGVKATIIRVVSGLKQLDLRDDLIVRVEAGVSCAKLAQFCLKHELIRCAFLAGIPGTVGGALAMNAGAFGDEIWKHVIAVETIDRAGVIRVRNSREFNFGYRKVEGLQSQEWFVAGYLQFTLGDVNAERKKIREFWKKRLISQPIGELSCGSVFKNPIDNFAGHLIEDCGLKGKRIGGAKVSEKHANFIINEGKATASDIEKLMQLIKLQVFEKRHISLEAEVKIIED